MRDIAKWLLENRRVLEEFLDKGIALHQWEADLEYYQKVVSGLDGNFKINFICPIYHVNAILNRCEIELEFMLERHNPVVLRHIKYVEKEPHVIIEEIELLKDDDFIHLEGRDNAEQVKEAKELIYRRLKVTGGGGNWKEVHS